MTGQLGRDGIGASARVLVQCCGGEGRFDIVGPDVEKKFVEQIARGGLVEPAQW